MSKTYMIEVTDTFAGESNYSWVRRFKVGAVSPQGAMAKVSREMGMRTRKAADYGDMVRYDAIGACICAFVEWFDESRHEAVAVKVL